MEEFRHKVDGKDVFVIKIGTKTLDNPKEMEFFISSLNGFYSSHVMVVTGGGELSRKGDKLMQRLTPYRESDLADKRKRDLIGIIATKYHAQLLNEALGIEVPIWDYEPTVAEIKDFLDCRHRRIQIVSGWYPGTSSDGPAVMLADKCGVDLVKIGTPVFEKSPEKDPDAKVIPRITWKKYSEMFPCYRDPSGHAPIDEESATLAERYGLRVAIGNWVDLRNGSLEKFISNGTLIVP